MKKMTEEEQRLWEAYQHEMTNGYGFGAPSKWIKGERSFKAFLAINLSPPSADIPIDSKQSIV